MCELFCISVDLDEPFTYFQTSLRTANGEVLESYTDLSEEGPFRANINAVAMLPDVVKTSGIIFSFSQRARDLLNGHGIPTHVDWKLVEFRTETIGDVEMWAFHPTSRCSISAVDLSRTDAEWLLPGKVASKIHKYAIRRAAIPNAGIFSDRSELDIFVTAAVVEEWRERAFTGLRFSPVLLVD